MKALSIRQPWADFILNHGKDIENRTWGTGYRGKLLIHASKTVDDDAAVEAYHNGQVPFGYTPTTGAIIGMVTLTACGRSNSHWAEPGMTHWTLDQPVRFTDPIPYRGQQGLFDVPAEVVAEAIGGAK